MNQADVLVQLKEIKNKKVRAFYSDQNDRINDWLEVDALVMALADDVIDSMDPDRDNDGRRERTAGLQDGGGNIWDFLPEDEKERRAKAEKKAKWAININVIANIILLIAKVRATHTSPSCVTDFMTDHCRLLFVLTLSNRISR